MILLASPFAGVIMTLMGLFQVGSQAGYVSVCALYLRTRPGIVKAADFPLPVAVQQRIFQP